MLLQHRVGNTYVVSRRMRALTHSIIGFFLFGQMQIVVAQTSILPTTTNGWTTTATTSANVTEITNTRNIGGNAYNSFEKFGVAAGQTVNLRMEGADNLVNLVRFDRTDINGVLNSYLTNGSIGGNVFFVNPNGITVGAGGVVNVGSLSMVVPTQSAMDNYIAALQDVNATADDRLLFIGSMQLDENGEIDIQGTINANSGVLLLANTVNVSGNITSAGANTATAATGAELFGALVKVAADFQDELGIFEVNGEIVIGAAGSSGGIINDLNPVKNTSASINISNGANIQADGAVQISAAARQKPAAIDNGLVEWNTTSASVDVSGARIKSVSGEVVIDADSNVDLAIGGLNGLPISAAIARSDAQAKVNIAGTTVIEAATNVSIGASSKTKISATANAESEAATLTIAVANIDNTSSAVVGGSTTIDTTAGAVKIDSVSDADIKVMADGLLSDGSGGGLAIAVTDVDSSAKAAITGAAQILNSSSLSVTSSVANSIDTAARSVATGNPQSISDTVSGEDALNDNPSGDPAGLKNNINTALNDSADLEDSGQSSSPQLAAAFAYTGVDSASIATIDSGINDATGALINSSGAINVVAKLMTDAANLAQGTTAVGADASITAGVSILLAKEVISATVKPAAGKLTVTADALNVAALNEDYSAPGNAVGDMLSIAYAGAGGGGDMGLAGALAINIQDRDAIANVSGDGSLFININGDLDIAASSSVSDAVVASALLSTAQAQDAEDKFAANSAAQQDAVAPVANPDEGGSLGVGAAIAINVIDNNTQADVGAGVSIANTANNISVDASSDSTVITKAEAGSSGGISIVPVLALSSTTDTTLATINAGGAAIDVQNSILINAKHSGSVTTYAKGSPGEQGGGGTASVGASIGLGIATETTSAGIARNVIAGAGNNDTVTVASSSSSRFATGAIAGSAGSSDDGDGTTVDSQLAGVVAYRNAQSSDTAGTESAETSDGKVGVAAAIAYQGTSSRAESSVADGVSVTAGGKLAVTSQKQISTGAKANGAAAGANAGVGAAVAITTTTNSNIARIGDDTGVASATMATGGIEVMAYSDEAYVNNAVQASEQALSQFGAAAVAGASSQGVGVAGALALNILSDTTNASIEGNTLINVSAAPVSVGAESQSNTGVNAAGTVGVLALDIEEPETPSVSSAGTSPAPGPASGSSSVGVGAGVAVNAASNRTVARIGSGVSFAPASTVAVDASSKADATVVSTAGVAGDATATVGVGGAVAVSVIASNTRAEIENRTEILSATTAVSISASHSGAINVSTDGSAAGSNAAIGASIAISVSDVIIQALLSRDVGAGSVDLAASSNTSNTTLAKASASGAEQEDPPATAPAPGEKTGVDKKAGDLTTFAGDKKAGGSAGDPDSESTETPGGAVTVAAGLAVTVTEATVRAENTGTINTTGNTSITSESAADAKATADGSAVDGSNSVGIGAAVAVNTLTQRNTATANNINSSGGLTVGATQITGEENDTGAVATSGAGASNVGIAGSVAVNVVSNKSTASFVNGTVSGGVVDIDASNKTNSVTKAGSSVVGSGNSVGIGAGIAVDVVVNEILAVITSAADVTGSDSVAVDADSTFTAEVKGEAGGQGDAQPSGGAVGISGAVAVGVYSNKTKAEIAAGSALTSAGEVHIGASHTNKINVETGADAAGDKAAIGASIAIAVSKAETDALISRDINADSLTITASSSTSNATKAKASASGAAPKDDAASDGSAPADDSSVNKDIDSWQTFATDKDDSGSTAGTETEKKDASSSEGQVSVAAAVAVTVTDVDTVARIDNNVTVTTANSVAVTSTANTDAQATADGSAANGGIGVGVGVAINVANNYNAAFIAQGANVQAGSIAVTAGMTEDVVVGEPDPDTVNTFSAEAASGAGAAKVGVAGSLALNTVTNESTAYIAGNENAGIAARVYTPGELSVSATNNAKHAVSAGASVSGTGAEKSVGIGASVAINTFTNKANAKIRDGVTIAGNRSTAAEAGSLTMASSSEYDSETKAEAGAEGEEGADPSNDIAVDASVALVIANNETRTTVGAADTSAGFSGNIDLNATSNQSNTTEAGADSAGSKVAIGAVAAVNLGISNTAIAVNADLKTSAGNITMDAVSTSADKALAKASARGASKKKAQDKYGASEDEIDSGDYGNGADDKKATSSKVLSDNSSTMEQPETGDTKVDDESGDKGKWNVSIAAAVGANVVDNNTTVIVASDKALAAAGTIDVNASSDSNYMTRGSGEAVADSGSGKGIGIGVGVAVTVASNDTVARVSSIDGAGDVSITAKSTQNMNADFIKELTSEAIAGASADKVAVAGAVATVVTSNNTRAEIVDNAIIGDIGALNVSTSDQSKISSRAVAWVDPAKKTAAGVGASAAILVSKNSNTARIGDGVIINSADSINVEAVNKRVTPETVGLDFSKIINFDDILNSALLAGRTAVSGDDSDNTGTEPEVDPETGGPAIIFDKLKAKAADAKHALEDYIRSHNYYTEAAAGSASTGGSAKYGAAGSFAVTVLLNKTEASIGNVTVGNVAANVDVTADTDTDIAGFTGSVVKAGKVGVGVSATTLVNLDATRALLGNDSAGAAGTVSLGTSNPAFNVGDLNINASSDQDILGIGVSAAAASSKGGKGVALSGVLNTTVLVNKAEARIANDAQVYSSGSVDVTAEGITDIVSVVGGIALGGKAGVGASVGTSVISGQTHAAIGNNAIVSAKDSITVSAAADEEIISIVVGAGASKKVGVAGSLATNVIAASTTATIGNNARVTQSDARDVDGLVNAITVQAEDNTRLFSLAGGGAIGGKAGVGAAADVAVFSKNTVAKTSAGSTLVAGGNVAVTAKSKDDIISLTGAGAGSSSGAAVAGVASVKVVVDITQALIDSLSVIAGGNVDLLAQSDTDLNIYDGTIAVSGGSAGVGGAVAVNTLVKDTAAKVAAGVNIVARGDVADSLIYNGDLDRSGYVSIGSIARPDSDSEPAIGVNAGELTDAQKQTSARRGLSVTAFSTEDIETIGISASASKNVAVAGNLSVDVIANTTEAAIATGATVNAVGIDAADSSASVLVQAYDYTDLNAMLGSGALGVSAAGVGAAGDVSTIVKTTLAHIDANANISAEQDVAIRAGSEEDIDSVAAAVGVGSSAGVSGAASVLIINSETRAYTESNTDINVAGNTINIDAGRDFVIEALNRSDLFVFNTALAAGSTAGVGGSAGVVVMTNSTEAKVGRGTVSEADRRTVVRADSDEKLTAIAMGAAGGGTAGVSGQLGVHVLASDTAAIVEDDVTMNKARWNDIASEDEQSVAVLANNKVDLLSIAGTIALGGTAGVGGALTADVVLNKVRATVGKSEIYAGAIGNGNVDLGGGLIVEDGVSIRAGSEKDLTAVSVAGSGGGTAGVAGAASILIVGSDYDENDKTRESFGADMDKFISTGEGSSESSQLAVADSGADSRTGDTLGAQGDVEVSSGVSVTQFVDSKSQASGSTYFALNSASGATGDTIAVVASGAKIKTKGDLEVSANDSTTLNVVGGSIAVGGTAGVGGAGALVLLNQGTRALIQDDDIAAVELDAARTMNVNARADSQIFDVTATVAAGGAAGVSGSLLLNVVDSRAEASIGNGALVNQDGSIVADADQSVIVDANNSNTIIATTANGSGSGTAAVGGVALVNVLNSRTKASIGQAAQVDALRDVKVIADASEQVIANGASAAISGVAGVGGVINVSTITTNTEAKIASGAVIDSDGNVLLAAEDDTSLVANSWGVAVGLGGAGVGGSFGVNTIVKNTSAVIAEGATVNARGNNTNSIDVYTGKLVNSAAGDTLLDNIIDEIEDETGNESQDGKWKRIVGLSGADRTDGTTPAASTSLGNSNKVTEQIKGLAVVASSTEDVLSSNASAAGGLYAGVSGSGQVLSLITDTDARVEKVVSIDAADIRLSAASHTDSFSLSGGLALSGVAGVGGAVANGNFIKSTNATLGSDALAGGGVDVTASGDVIVDAESSEDIDEILVNVAGAGIAGVGGGIGVHVVVSDTTAEVGNNSVIDAAGDLRVRANSNTEIDAFNGNLSIGGIAGVGAAVGTNVVANTTTARIGDDATTDADDATEVSADSLSNVESITIAASGGAVGVAGGIQVNVVNTMTQAFVGLNAQINTAATGNAGQSVSVTASDDSTISSTTAAAAVGAGAVGGTVSVDILRNSASATIASGAAVNANNSIDITAATFKTLNADSVSAAAGGFGMAGSIAVAAIGGNLNNDAYKQINGEDANGNENAGSGSVNKAGSSSGVNPLASDDDNSQLNDFNSTSGLADDVDQRNADREANYGVSDDVASSPNSRSATLAAVGSAATLKAGGNLNVTAVDTTNTSMLTGAVSAGAVAGAGAAAITVVENATEAKIASNAVLDSGASLTVRAANNKTLNSTAASGAVSFANSIAGSIGVTVDSSSARAHVDSGARINQDAATRALASQQNVVVQAVNNAVIDVITGAVSLSIGSGIGGTLNVVTTSQTTQALIDVGPGGRVSAEGLINVAASSSASFDAKSAVGAGGLTAGIAGGVVTLFDDSTTSASIKDGSVIDDADEVKVTAQSTRTASADTKGAAIGAVGVGGSVATTEMAGVTTATVADNAGLGVNASIGSLTVDATATETATAKAVALAAGIISGAGAVATTRINSTVAASTGRNTRIVADNAVKVRAQATPKALSRTTAGSFGAATVGASVAVVEVNPDVSATLDGSSITAGSLQLSSKVLTPGAGRTADAYAEAASGGLLLGANATVSDTSVTGRAISSLAAGTQLNVAGNTLISSTQNSNQYAETKSFAGGLAALGGAFSKGRADTVSTVTIADGSSITSGTLTLDASGDDRNQVKAKAGTGGAIAGAAAVTETENTSITSVTVGNGTIVTSRLDADARHTARFDQQTDSSSAGLLGASGAVADHSVDAQVAVTLAGVIEAGVIDARAANNVYKNLVSGYNVSAGAGGLVGGAAADSDTVINRMTATVTVAPDTQITSGDNAIEGIILEAFNQLIVDDSAKLDSGGAIAIALADASIIANNVAATVAIGDRVSIETGGDLIAAAASRLNVKADAKASTYGAAGAAAGQSTARVTARNTVTSGTDSVLYSSGQTKLMSGRTADSQGVAQSVLAYTDLWNKTAFPVETKPEADAYLNNSNRVAVANGSLVSAGDDIYLIADKGNANVKGQGTGKDLYRQTLEDTVNFFGNLVGADDVSFDITGGSTTRIASESVTIDGLVHAGIDNKLKFKIRRLSPDTIAFYEGDYPDGADDAYFNGLTPTLLLTMTNGVLSAVDSQGNPVVVSYDAVSNRYTVVSSDDGLSTTFDLDSSFNPMAALEERLAEINIELDNLRYTAGVYTNAEVAQREALSLELEQIEADILALSQTRDSIQDISGSGATIIVGSLAGIQQMRTTIADADTSAVSETLIAAPLDVWNKQVDGLDKVRADVLAQRDADNQLEIDQVLLQIDDQMAKINSELIDVAGRINTDIVLIAALDADTLANPGNAAQNDADIADARVRIGLERVTMGNYSNVLNGDLTDLNTRLGTLSSRQTVATTELDAITGSRTGESAFQPMIQRIEKEQTWVQGRIADYNGGTSFELIDFTEQLSARSGNIYVESDVLSGQQNLAANRDTEVSVYNDTEAYMRISGGAEIPFDAGGRILVNGAQINRGAPGVSKIEFVNDFRPSNLDAPGPDLIIDADISNYNGDILLRSAAGGVQTGAGVDIDANTVRIVAGRDVILSYTGGIRHLGGDVKCNFDANADCGQTDAIPGIVAGNNVYIAGEYLNINAKIQSGRPDIVIEINGTAASQYGVRTVDSNGNSILDDDGSLVLKTAADGSRYFELKPQIVAGGYVDLYGHIMSTSNSPASPGGSGEIQVMDGYGRITVNNNTAYDIVVDGLSAGTGVQGRVRITDLDNDLLGSGNDKVTEYTYFRDNNLNQQVEVNVSWNADAPNTAFYNDSISLVSASGLNYQPLANQYYSWENVVRVGFRDTRKVERRTYFGLFSDTTKYKYLDNRTSSDSGAPVRDDLLLVVNTPTANPYWNTATTINVDATGFRRYTGITKNEYVVYRYETWREERSRINYDYTKHFVKADNPIAINFVGYGAGAVDLLSNAGGGFDLAGDIRNSSGTTRIITSGAVSQSNPDAILSTRELTLDVGSAGEKVAATPGLDSGPVYIPLRVNIAENGRLAFANASAGDLIYEQLAGDLVFGDIDASGEVWLKSSGDIINDKTMVPAGDNTISGRRVTLVAENGEVGSSGATGMDRFILVNTQASDDGGLEVMAADDIYVSETNGDLQLVSATSTAGDLYINVQNGSLIDNNPVEEKDTRTIQQLLGIWDSMQFLTETTGPGNQNSVGGTSATFNVAERNIQAQETLKTREYQTYWRYRNKLSDPSAPVTDTTVRLSETEASFFSDPDAVAAERSAEFARLNETYGDIGNSYDENYRYTVVAGSEEYRSLTERAGWTELELLAAMGPGLLKEISDTKTLIEEANATGNNVNITVGNGDIGSYIPDNILIDLDTVADYTELSDAQKLALLTAERRDVRFDESSYDEARQSYTRMYISTYDDLDVDVGGTLTAGTVNSQRVYIGSENDLAINRVLSSGDVRIRTTGQLTDASVAANAAVTGKDIILESGDQSIGSTTNTFEIEQLVGGSLTARAGDSIWLTSGQSEPLAIDTVFASNLFSLKTAGDVVEYKPDAGVDVRADSVTLDIGGSFGAAGDLVNSIDVGLNPEGILTAQIADDAWIASPDRDLRIGRFEVGATSRVVGNGNLKLQSDNGGMVSTAGKLTLLAGGSIVDEIMTVFDADGNVVAESDGARAIEAQELDLIASNGDIGAADNYLDIAVTGSQGVWAQADNGSIYIESPDNDLRLRHVSAGDDSALTTDGDILLIQSGDYRSTGGTLAFDAGGSILDESGDSLIEAMDLSLRAGSGSIGSAARSLQLDTQSISRLNATSGMYLTETRGDMNIAYLYNAAGDAVLHVASLGAGLNITDGVVDGRMLWTADNMQVDKLVHGGNAEELYFDITGSGGGMANTVNITYRSEKKVRFGNLEANQARIIGDVNDLRFDRVLIGEQAVLSNDTTSVFVDNINSGLHKQYTIQLTSQDAPFFLTFVPDSNKIETDAIALYYDEDWIVNEFSTENSLPRLVEKDLAYLTGPVPDVKHQAEHFDDVEPVEVNDDALNLRSVDDSEIFLPMYWSDI